MYLYNIWTVESSKFIQCTLQRSMHNVVILILIRTHRSHFLPKCQQQYSPRYNLSSPCRGGRRAIGIGVVGLGTNSSGSGMHLGGVTPMQHPGLLGGPSKMWRMRKTLRMMSTQMLAGLLLRSTVPPQWQEPSSVDHDPVMRSTTIPDRVKNLVAVVPRKKNAPPIMFSRCMFRST